MATSKPRTSIPLLFFSFLLCFPLPYADNPVSAPVLNGNIELQVKPFAKLPNFNNVPARILMVANLSDFQYAVTHTHIYKIYQSGFVKLLVDYRQAIQNATGRALNMQNTVHGGLRSLAFHPNFWNNGLIYTSHMEDRPTDAENLQYLSDVPNPIGADSVVAEWKLNLTSLQIDISSYRQVLRIGMPVYDHPIKQIAFYQNLLYIAHGDGSVKSAIAGGGQKNDALGKILRINPLQDGENPYSVPNDNPFLSDPTMLDEVYALGFRNPHNICFSNNGTLIAVDAGRDNVEEVNIVKKGLNYGWSLREGTFVHKPEGGVVTGVGPLPDNDAELGLEYPVAQYGHESHTGEAFVGQAIAGACPIENGSPLDGVYFYADFPVIGLLYYSFLHEMITAKTNGPPTTLTQAPTRKVNRILYDHDSNTTTPPMIHSDLGGIVRSDPDFGERKRVDLRFGRGTRGEIYFSSKQTGRIYLITSSLPVGEGNLGVA